MALSMVSRDLTLMPLGDAAMRASRASVHKSRLSEATDIKIDAITHTSSSAADNSHPDLLTKGIE
ncbi:carnitine acetyl transferase [Moniliophthora roreri]|nr:carnitine acetyl transferase [Moniliophthora roreri]